MPRAPGEGFQGPPPAAGARPALPLVQMAGPVWTAQGGAQEGS